MSRIDKTLNKTIQRLTESYKLRKEHSYTAHLDAEVLLYYTLEKPYSYLFTWPEKVLTSNQLNQFEAVLNQRLQGVPIAYLTGEKDFWSLNLKVTPSVLIPRPDTEHLIELALTMDVCQQAVVADLGTGSGAIALAIAYERPKWSILAVEKFSESIAIAKENASKNCIKNVQFLLGSWCEPLPENLDMIVSNPPYIRENDAHLSQGDIQFEPKTALIAGHDGLNDIRLIAKQATSKLKSGGWLLFEHAYDQAIEIHQILNNNGFKAIKTRQDLSNHDRITFAQKLIE